MYDIIEIVKNMVFKFKNDMYKKARGGYSRFINLYCSLCGTYLLLYQKDGPGSLKRLYMDRIFAPKELVCIATNSTKEMPKLACLQCKREIGIPTIYEKENRKTFQLISFSIIKKVSTGIYPPKLTNITVKRQK